MQKKLRQNLIGDLRLFQVSAHEVFIIDVVDMLQLFLMKDFPTNLVPLNYIAISR